MINKSPFYSLSTVGFNIVWAKAWPQYQFNTLKQQSTTEKRSLYFCKDCPTPLRHVCCLFFITFDAFELLTHFVLNFAIMQQTIATWQVRQIHKCIDNAMVAVSHCPSSPACSLHWLSQLCEPKKAQNVTPFKKCWGHQYILSL